MTATEDAERRQQQERRWREYLDAATKGPAGDGFDCFTEGVLGNTERVPHVGEPLRRLLARLDGTRDHEHGETMKPDGKRKAPEDRRRGVMGRSIKVSQRENVLLKRCAERRGLSVPDYVVQRAREDEGQA